MLEGRKAQFVDELIQQGSTKVQAEKEVIASIDRLIYYAGWCDKFTQVFSAVNPVATSHFNFTTPEPTGVVSVIAPEDTSLIGLVSVIAPIIASGSSCVVLASESKPLCSITFAEVLNSSDVPGGVVNILTGKRTELLKHMASHMDVNAFLYANNDSKELLEIEKQSVENLKRVVVKDLSKPYAEEHENPYYIEDFLEMKTTWHPIEKIGAKGSGY
jgi:acyl-CoA reductase-like NAD-dependent aldehyde dehydrogenase